MAELLTSEANTSAASDVCEKCVEVFKLVEGCPCKVCGRRHWHDEICYPAVRNAVESWDWSMKRMNGTRVVFAEHVFHYLVSRIAIRMNIRPDIESVVVGFLSSAREGRVQVWVRDITRLSSPLTLDQIVESLYGHMPVEVAWEAIRPPPHEHLPR